MEATNKSVHFTGCNAAEFLPDPRILFRANCDLNDWNWYQKSSECQAVDPSLSAEVRARKLLPVSPYHPWVIRSIKELHYAGKLMPH